MLGGESLAHRDIAHRFKVEFEHLPLDPRALERAPTTCRAVMFRVVSVGRVAATGITARLAQRSCRTMPYGVGPFVFARNQANCSTRKYT